MVTAITNVRVFDGEQVVENTNVVIDGHTIRSVGDEAVPTDAAIEDGAGCTLLPGLIDSHTHISTPENLQVALAFGVTTELEMSGDWTAAQRRELAERDDGADFRSPGLGLTAPDGHPTQFLKLLPEAQRGDPSAIAGIASGPDSARVLVAQRVAAGADYIKLYVEEGTCMGSPGLGMLDQATVEAAVEAAHAHGKLALAHALTFASAQQAVAAGVDGLAHVFLDRPHTAALVAEIRARGVFVTPCISINAALLGLSLGAELAADPRVGRRLDAGWRRTLQGSFGCFPTGKLEDVLGTVGALHAAGVDVLCGTDAVMASQQEAVGFGGFAHGASVHLELQLLVRAGLTPREALRAATSLPAKRFGLEDRGLVKEGMRADLLLVEGNPVETIGDTLSIKGVWRRGARLEL